MDNAEAMSVGIVVIEHLITVATAAAVLGESCCVASFEGVRVHTGDCLVSWWDKQGSLWLGSRARPLVLYDDIACWSRMLAKNAFGLSDSGEAKRFGQSGIM